MAFDRKRKKGRVALYVRKRYLSLFFLRGSGRSRLMLKRYSPLNLQEAALTAVLYSFLCVYLLGEAERIPFSVFFALL